VVSTQTTVRPAVQTPPAPTPALEPPGPPLAVFVPLIGFLVLLGLATIFSAARDDVPTAASLVGFALAVAGCAWFATLPVTLLLTACAFMDYDGFVLDQQGQFSWDGRADAARLLVLSAVAITTQIARRMHHRRQDASR
jgi:hypothetical protein